MHYRLATAADLPACFALLRSAGLTRHSTVVWDRLLPLWTAHLAADRHRPKAVTVWEEPQAEGPPLLHAFGNSVFVSDDTYAWLRAGTEPYYGNRLQEAWLEGRHLPLDARAIARANAGSGLNVVVPAYVQRHHDLDHPDSRRLMSLGAAAWFFSHGGYNVRRILWEAYGAQEMNYLLAGGFRHLRSFAEVPDAAPEAQPHWCEIDRADHPLAAFNALNLWTLRPPAPCMGLPLSQQSVALLALQGDTDQRIAARLHISLDAVKQAWRGIVTAAAPFIPEARELSNGHLLHAVRGAERRRGVLEYLRQHMEELRPWPRSERGRSGRDAGQAVSR